MAAGHGKGAVSPNVRNMPADSGTPREEPRIPPVGNGRVRAYPLPEAIIEHTAEGLCVCHEVPEHPFVQFTVWNRRMIEITGYTMEEINQLGWYQTVRRRAVEPPTAWRRCARGTTCGRRSGGSCARTGAAVIW